MERQTMTARHHVAASALVFLALIVWNSSTSPIPGIQAASTLLINGAGATFPYPIYAKWFDQYHQAHSDIQINYQSIGSGGGIRQLLDKTVDFGASDGPMNDDQLKQASVPILHFPTVLGAAIPAYNLPGIQGDLNFTPEALSGIFLGTV